MSALTGLPSRGGLPLIGALAPSSASSSSTGNAASAGGAGTALSDDPLGVVSPSGGAGDGSGLRSTDGSDAVSIATGASDTPQPFQRALRRAQGQAQRAETATRDLRAAADASRTAANNPPAGRLSDSARDPTLPGEGVAERDGTVEREDRLRRAAATEGGLGEPTALPFLTPLPPVPAGPTGEVDAEGTTLPSIQDRLGALAAGKSGAPITAPGDGTADVPHDAADQADSLRAQATGWPVAGSPGSPAAAVADKAAADRAAHATGALGPNALEAALREMQRIAPTATVPASESATSPTTASIEQPADLRVSAGVDGRAQQPKETRNQAANPSASRATDRFMFPGAEVARDTPSTVTPARNSEPMAAPALSARAAEPASTSQSAFSTPVTPSTPASAESPTAPGIPPIPPQGALPTGFAAALRESEASMGHNAARSLTDRLSTAMDAPGFGAALGLKIRDWATDGIQNAWLEVHPADMGPVAIRIQVDGQQAQLDFGAASAAARSVLENSLPDLAAALQGAGLTLSGGGVYEQLSRRDADASGQDASASAGVGNGRKGRGPEGTDAGSDRLGLSSASGLRALRPQGLIDTYV